MKEILLKFETEELYAEFINKVVVPQITDQLNFPQQMKSHLEWDEANNIGIIKAK